MVTIVEKEGGKNLGYLCQKCPPNLPIYRFFLGITLNRLISTDISVALWFIFNLQLFALFYNRGETTYSQWAGQSERSAPEGKRLEIVSPCSATGRDCELSWVYVNYSALIRIWKLSVHIIIASRVPNVRENVRIFIVFKIRERFFLVLENYYIYNNGREFYIDDCFYA